MDAHAQRLDDWLLDLGREQRAVARLARGLVSHPQEAEDLAQSAWLVWARRRPAAGPGAGGRSGDRGSGLGPWWRAVLQRERARGLRGARAERAREVEVFVERTGESPERWLERSEMTQCLIAEVRTLPQEAQRILGLHYGEGRPWKAIARALGEPEGTVRSRHHRALAQLRARLEARFPEGERDWRSALLPLLAPPVEPRFRNPSALPLADGVGRVVASAGLWAAGVGVVLASGLMLWLGLGGSPSPAQLPPLLAVDSQPSPQGDQDPDRGQQPPPALATALAPAQGPGSPRVELLPAGAPPAKTTHRSAVRLALVDPDGRPVVGARVEGDLAGAEPAGPWDPRRLLVSAHRAESDSQGRVALATDLLRRGQNVELTAQGPGDLHWSKELWVEPGDTVDLGTVTLVPAARLEVTTVDERGRGLRANLEIETLDGPPPPFAPAPRAPWSTGGTGQSNRHGTWVSGPLQARWVRVWASAEDRGPTPSAPLELRPGERHRVQISLPRATVVTPLALCVTTHDGTPVHGALVSALQGRATRSLTTSPAGRASFGAHGGMSHADRLIVSDPRQLGAPVELGPLDSRNGEVAIALPLPETSTLLVASRGAPVPAFRVVLWVDAPFAEVVEARGQNGRVQLIVPHIARFHLRIFAEGHPSYEERDWTPDTLRQRSAVELPSGTRLEGRVLHEGQGVHNASVTLSSALPPGGWVRKNGFPSQVGYAAAPGVSSDGEGRFALALPRTGSWYLLVEAEGYAPLLEGPMHLGEGADLDLGDVHLCLGGELHVRVVDGRGQPISGLPLAATRHGPDGRIARTDVDGWARFAGLAPARWHVFLGSEQLLAMGKFGSWIEALPLHSDWIPPVGVEVRDETVTAIQWELDEQPVALSLRVATKDPGGFRLRIERDRTRDPFANHWSRTFAPKADGSLTASVPSRGFYSLQLLDPAGTLVGHWREVLDAAEFERILTPSQED